MRLGLCLATAAAAPLLIGAAEPVRLQPSTRWVVDYAADSCKLSRTFGTGDSETILQFESDVPGEREMVVVGKPLESSADSIPARFLPVQNRTSKDFLATGHMVRSTGKGEPAIIYPYVQLLPDDEAAKADAEWKQRRPNPRMRPPARNVPQEISRRAMRQAFADAVTALEIATRSNRPVILETGSLGNAMKAFEQCSRNSLKDWGVDPDLEDKIARPVWAENPGSWIDWQDYPKKMLDENQQSEVRVRVLVDASGRVAKCTTISHFKLPEFNQLVCDRIRKFGKFLPAELSDGTKVPYLWTTRFNFRIAT